MARIPAALPLLLAACASAGCVERTLRIRSEPPGLEVAMNGRPLGATPLDVPFSFYGTVRLETPATDLDGDGWPEVRRSVALVELSEPWYQWFPLDFFSDNLLPWTVRDDHEALLTPPVHPPPGGEGGDLRREAEAVKIRAERARVEAEIEAGAREGEAAKPAPAPAEDPAPAGGGGKEPDRR